jgi:hypothetical protein
VNCRGDGALPGTRSDDVRPAVAISDAFAATLGGDDTPTSGSPWRGAEGRAVTRGWWGFNVNAKNVGIPTLRVYNLYGP